MKNSNFKRILSTVLFVALVLATVFAISACKKEHVHDLKVVTVDPTCTEDGSRTSTCLDPECDFQQTDVLPALGHNNTHYPEKAATCTEEGCLAYDVCKTCGHSTYSDDLIIEKADHIEDKYVVEGMVDPTCTEFGSYDVVYNCKHCGIELRRNSFNITNLGHDWKNVEAKTATCLPGNYAYRECKTCGQLQDADGNNIDEIPTIAPMYDHLASDHPIEVDHKYADYYLDPTCTEEGFYTLAICCINDECGLPLFLDEVFANDERYAPTTVVVEALGHDYKDVAAKDPTCLEKGWDAYKQCTRCDDNDRIVKDPLGHTPGETVVEGKQEATCTEADSHYDVVYCTVCSEELDRVLVVGEALGHDLVAHEGKTETCTEIGWNAYDTCKRCDYTTYDEIPATGHNESDFVIQNFEEPTCAEAGSYDRVVYCLTCEVDIIREHWIVDPVAHAEFITIEAKAPTCTEIGWNEYTCCSKCSYSDNYVELKAIGHDIVELEYKAPNCVDTGLTAGQYCSRCDDCTVEQEVIAANGHNMVYLSEVEPSCTDTGLTAGQYCTECDACTVEQVVVDALGHNRDADGLCSRCGDKASVGLDYAVVDGGYVFTGLGSCNDQHVNIPSEINGVKVVGIAENAFKNSNVVSVTIPDTVKTIENNAFFGCVKLTTVTIGDGVEHIEKNAFFGCTKLTSITIGSSVKSIGASAFASCANLKDVYYQGTAAEWNQIEIGLLNTELTNANRHYN